MEFEWDTAKEKANLRKHGISFADSAFVFDDPFRLEEDSSRPEHGEERRKTIGQIGPIVVTVIFTIRQERRRLISARRASNDERERYGQGPPTS